MRVQWWRWVKRQGLGFLNIGLLAGALAAAERMSEAERLEYVLGLPESTAAGALPPMVLWHGVGLEALEPEVHAALRTRGFVQHLRFEREALEAAQAVQAAGLPVIFMQGMREEWLRDLVGEELPEVALPGDRYAMALDARTWRWVAEAVRARLAFFAEAGVEVDGLWLDYEGLPFLAKREDVLARPELVARLPEGVLVDEAIWRTYRRQWTLNLLSSYVAAPAREVFPRISVLNWVANLSYPERPMIDWWGRRVPASGPLLFTATNPYAYGNDAWLWQLDHQAQLPRQLSLTDAWGEGEGRPGLPAAVAQRVADELYTDLLLRQVSADWEQRRSAPYLESVPWVGRVVKDVEAMGLLPEGAEDYARMSRPAYREALRHLWLRGITTMQIFNPYGAELDRAEIADAAATWRDAGEWRERFAEPPQPMHTDTRAILRDKVLWSGWQGEEGALVRVIGFLGAPKTLEIPYADTTHTLPIRQVGRTYWIDPDGTITPF